MNFGENCRKGPFPQLASLQKHTQLSENCNQAAKQKWGTFSSNIWENDVPGHLNRQNPPPILEDDELPGMPDITLEEDLQELQEDLVNYRQYPPAMFTPPVHGVMPAEPGRVSATTEDAEATVANAYYIEEFPEDLGVGAVWGEELPSFEILRQEQEKNVSSRWGPFDDEDEWDLAKWLIKNTGQNQINSFLNLNIVKSHHFWFHSY
jgi:hypothetical protein